MSLDKNDMHNDEKSVDFDPFAGLEIIRIAPTVEPQQEIWISCMIGGPDANRGYNESVSLLMKGKWDQSAMEKALQALINRHESLRASFSGDGSEMVIYKEFPLNLKQEDLSKKSDAGQKEFIKTFAIEDAATPFDLLNGPLYRFAVFNLNDTTHYLTLTAHHIICDGWSVGIMLQDLGKLYSAYTKGEEPKLPEAIRFTQYAEEQGLFSHSPEYAVIENYWLNQFRNSVPVLNMPIDFTRPAKRTYKSHREDYELDHELIGSVKKLGARAGSSLVSTLLSAFEIFLYRLTGQDDIVLGLPAAGQSASGNHALVGHCVHLLPLRSHPKASQSFLEYLKERKSKIFDDYDHQQFTFGSLLKKLNIARDPARVPLVPVVFNMDMGLDDGVSFEALQYELFYNPREYENFELSVNASGSEERFVLEWSYNTQLFKSSTIQQMMEEFEGLLRFVVAKPEIPVGEIPTVYNQNIFLSDHSSDFPKDKSVAALFSEQAKRTPEKTAIAFDGDQYNYRQLDEISNQLAHYLLKKGIKTNSLVPICIERSLHLLVSILGILKAGAAFVPIDPEYPADRVAFMLEDTDADILLTTRHARNKISGVDKVKCILIDEKWDLIQRELKIPPPNEANGESLAYIMYTSGSTGKPKGVMIENSNVVSLVRGVQYVGLTGNEVILSTG